MKLAELLSQLDAQQDSSFFRQVDPVGGKYTVTAVLPTVEDILDWQEGRCSFNYGYYRFIDHPLIHTLQEELARYYHIKNCMAYTTHQCALMELLDYLLLAKPRMTIKVIHEQANDPLLNRLEQLQTNIVQVLPADINKLQPLSAGKDEIILLAVPSPDSLIEQESSFFELVRQQRIPVIVSTSELPETTWDTATITYRVCELDSEKRIQGGVILSNADRPLAALRELRKQKGPVLSSRNLDALKQNISTPPSRESQILGRLCDMEHARYGFLFPSGMNAIATLFSILRTETKNQMVCIGHLYTDTYSLLTYGKLRSGRPDNIFLNTHELDQLPGILHENTAAIITETITNPLNDVPDLRKISEIARQHNIPVLVDNTFATPFNCNPLDFGVTAVIHSTTKYLSGANDHAGGAVLVNDETLARKIETFQQAWVNRMSEFETSVLWDHMQDFEQRMVRFNHNALQVAQFLEQHPAVQQVFYNQNPSHDDYAVAKSLLRGGGAVVSFTLKNDSLQGLTQFYNASLQPIIKAPSLGSNTTLVCPYTLLAHYHESDETLTELGLSRYLIRIAVGCEEDLSQIIDVLNQALS
ncbi:MAG: PLP-dependent transferase [SAR324 cluster bacterium]|nr:PLP-dependent transferase [SAR324 cluster bacterium]